MLVKCRLSFQNNTHTHTHAAAVSHIWIVYAEFIWCVFADVSQMHPYCLSPSFIPAELRDERVFVFEKDGRRNKVTEATTHTDSIRK